MLLALFVAGGRGRLIVNRDFARVGVLANTAARWLTELEALGYVERFADPHNRRHTPLRLTARGRADVLSYLIDRRSLEGQPTPASLVASLRAIKAEADAMIHRLEHPSIKDAETGEPSVTVSTTQA